MKRVMVVVVGCLMLLTVQPAVIDAGVYGDAEHAGQTRKPVKILQGIGVVDFRITCRREQTQQYFNQGISLLHGNDPSEADRSFYQACRIEPDCPMTWWGLAVANLDNPALATYYVQRAAELREDVTTRERQWIESLMEYVDQDRDEKMRRLNYVGALDRIAVDNPADTEAVAFLVRQFLDNRDAGSPLLFQTAVEALIAQVERACPEHPICCYRVRLWERQQPDRALTSAMQIRQRMPASPTALTVAGRLYSRLGQTEEAIKCFEASWAAARQRMQNDRVCLGEVSGSVENLQQLALHLSRVGRVREAIMLAKQLIKMPVLDQVQEESAPTTEWTSHSHASTPTTQAAKSSTILGQQLLLDVLLEFQLWDEILSLAKSNYLTSTDPETEARKVYAIGLAHFARQNAGGVREQVEALDSLAERLRSDYETYGRDPRREMLIRAFREELDVCDQIVFGNRSSSVLKRATRIPPQRMSALCSRIGDARSAVDFARKSVSAHPGQAAPLVRYAEALSGAGMQTDAAEQFQQLAARFGKLDADLPVVQRLTNQFGSLPARSTAAAAGSSEASNATASASLGTWEPLIAPPFALPDRYGQLISLNAFHGKPTLLVFYLGAGCPHCIEQLQSFSPLREDYERAGITVIAISADSVAGLKETFKTAGAEDAIPFLLVSDHSMKSFRAYGAFDEIVKEPLHGTFLVNPQGTILWQNISHEPFMATESLLIEAKRVLSLDDYPRPDTASRSESKQKLFQATYPSLFLPPTKRPAR